MISLCFDQRERLPRESESGWSPRCLVREKKETKVSFLSSRCSRASVFETESFIFHRGDERGTASPIFENLRVRSFHTSVFIRHTHAYTFY